ncbi:MAG TPA: twin-arginine translocase subunit TatC, partial [Phycisphaerales bacterium]|nr:twin-arginine translocase subunit TatC [Phycisphaerales bacterium]
MSSSEDHSMSFGDHLEELRKRVMWAMALPVPVMLVAYFFSDPLLDLLLRPLFVVLAGQGLRPEVLLLEPIELFFTQIKLAMLAGVVLGAPWIVYQLWLFVKPGLHQHERRFVNLLLPGSAILTILSVLLTYLVMLPFMLQVLVAIGANMTVHIPPIPVPAQAAEIIKAHEGQPLQTYLGKPANVAAGDIWLDVRDQKVRLAYNDAAGTQVVFDVPPTVEGGFRQDYRLNEYISFVL